MFDPAGGPLRKTVLFAALAAPVIAAVLFAQGFTHVGAQKCAICHKSRDQGSQFTIWEGTLHARSLESLTSARAAEAAMAMGTVDPTEDPACLKCHAPLADKAPELKAEGVSCETCHGPGSAYRKLYIMRDRALSAQNGLILYGRPEAINAMCLPCHENAHGVRFDFAAAWDRIRHPVPAK